MYIDCCTRVAGNPWRCDCDAIYTFYRTSRNATRKNLTLLCENPEYVRGESWDTLEDKCQSTVTPPLTTVTSSAANTTSVSTAQFSTTDQHGVSDQQSASSLSHYASIFLLIFVISLAALVCIVVVVVSITIRRLRRSTSKLDPLWWEDELPRNELMSK